MKKAAVIGNPITHSRSPMIHNYWLKKYGVEGTYEAIKAEDEKDFEKVVARLVDEDYSGFNVTVPFKEKAHDLVYYAIDRGPSAYPKGLNAANTIEIKDGKLIGHNTDYYGFIEAYREKKIKLDKINNVVILGAGGAARSIAFGMICYENQWEDKQKATITFLNRSIDRAKNLVSDLTPYVENIKLRTGPLDHIDEIISYCDLLINCTTLGMVGGPQNYNFKLNKHKININMIVHDIIYSPLETPLIKAAKDLGLVTLNGLSMLINQAAPAFDLFFGGTPDTHDDELYKILEKDLGK